MVRLFKILPGDAEYFGLLLIKTCDPQSYLNGHKRSTFASVYYEIPNFCASVTLVHIHTMYNWGSGITPKAPSGDQASLAHKFQRANAIMNCPLVMVLAPSMDSPPGHRVCTKMHMCLVYVEPHGLLNQSLSDLSFMLY